MCKFQSCLLGASLLLALFSGCSEEADTSDYEWPICDFVNPSVCFFVSDAQTGENLLDPDAVGTILGQPIAVTYGGKRYEVAEDAAAVPMTRATYVRPLALRLEKSDPLGNIRGRHLAFGDFSPTENFRDQSFVIDWGDGTSTQVEFDLYVTWKADHEERTWVPEVSSPIRIDGADRGEGYYDAWVVRIVR